MIVRLLLSQNVSPGLDRLTPDQQSALARSMTTVGSINRATLSEVVTEFTERLDNLALTSPNQLAAALALLEPHISPIARDGLRAEAEAGDGSDPWARITSLDAAALEPLLHTESAEVSAILLSKLGVGKAAALLTDLPSERAQMIAHAVALTATVSPDMVARIGDHLLTQVRAVPPTAFRASPVDRVGAILNAIATTTRDGLLEGLEARDENFAREVRRSIFTFKHIPRRLEPTDVPRVLRKLDNDVVIQAIAAGLEAAPVTVEFLLESMSKRLAEQMRDEAEAMGKPRDDEGEAAMGAIIGAIRELEEAGELRLLPPDDPQ